MTPTAPQGPTLGEVYILFGTTGEYSDRSEWVVRAYESRADADAEAERLNVIAREIFASGQSSWSSRADAVRERLQPHDALAHMDYTGTDYSVTACPLLRAASPTTTEN